MGLFADLQAQQTGSWWDRLTRTTGTLYSYAPHNLLAAAVLPGTREDYASGVSVALGGEPIGDRFEQSWGDAWRQTIGDLTPDYLYDPPAPRPGPDGSGAWFPQGLVPDAWEDPLKDAGKLLLVAAAVVAAAALNR